jgi:hypothetical protein
MCSTLPLPDRLGRVRHDQSFHWCDYRYRRQYPKFELKWGLTAPGCFADLRTQGVVPSHFIASTGALGQHLATGAGTLVGNRGLNQHNGLGGVVKGQLVDIGATTSGAGVFDIDPATGAATAGATVGSFHVFTLWETPESGTAALVGCALACQLKTLRSGQSA